MDQMTVMVRGLPVTVVSLEQLDQIVERYGDKAELSKKPKQSTESKGNNGSGTVSHDRVILEHLVQAGEEGVHTNALGDMLSRKGKAVKPGLLAWAIKIGLAADEANDPFEKARPAGGRGWKVKTTLLPLAKQLLEDMK